MNLSAKIGRVQVFAPGKTVRDMPKYLKSDRIVITLDTIEDLIKYLAVAKHIDYIPDHVAFNCDELEQRGMPVKNIASVLQLTADISCNRLGERNKKIFFVGTVAEPVSNSFVDELKEGGFFGIGPAIRRVGFEESSLYWKNFWDKKTGDWPKELITTFHTNVKEKKSLIIELTFRQKQVLHLITQRGLTNKQIAKELGVSEQAIKLHINILLKKYGVKNRTQLAVFNSVRQN